MPGTRLPDEVALRLVVGGRRWHPIQVAAIRGSVGRIVLLPLLSQGGVSHGESPAEQGCVPTRESGRLRALHHTPSSGQRAESPGAVFSERCQCPSHMSHRAVTFLTGAIWGRVSGIVNTLVVCRVCPITSLFFFFSLI